MRVLFYQLILQVFNGNSGRNDIVKHSLKEYASARFIRFQPTTYSGHKALRVEVFGVLVSTGINLNWWSNIAGADSRFVNGKRGGGWDHGVSESIRHAHKMLQFVNLIEYCYIRNTGNVTS